MDTDVTIQTQTLMPSAVEALGQLFICGPVWDGDVVSKPGRSQLIQLGLAHRWEGWTTLTAEGLIAAVEWKLDPGANTLHQLWHRKQNRK